MSYSFKEIEAKWQKKWDADNTFKAGTDHRTAALWN